jgi:DNA gyrase subunit A
MMLATETRVQVSILGYLSSDLKEAVRSQQETGDRRQETGDRRQETGDRRQETGDRRQETGDRRQETGDRRQEIIFIYCPHTPHPTPHFPTSPLPHTPLPHFPTSPHPTPYTLLPRKSILSHTSKEKRNFCFEDIS